MMPNPAAETDPAVRADRVAAAHPDTAPITLVAMLGHPDPWVQHAAAANGATPPTDIRRHAVAPPPGVPHEERVAAFAVRLGAARHPAGPRALLGDFDALLAGGGGWPSPPLLVAAAANPALRTDEVYCWGVAQRRLRGRRRGDW